MNNNIDISNESLKDAAKENALSYKRRSQQINAISEFIAGAQWQKEKDKAIIDKLMRIVRTCKVYFQNEANYPDSTIGYEIHKEAKQIIESLEQDI